MKSHVWLRALAGIPTLRPAQAVMYDCESLSSPQPLIPSSLFSKLYIVLHPSNLQTHWCVYLQGFPRPFGKGLVTTPLPAGQLQRATRKHETIMVPEEKLGFQSSHWRGPRKTQTSRGVMPILYPDLIIQYLIM